MLLILIVKEADVGRVHIATVKVIASGRNADKKRAQPITF
jgi:hypothetical protein